MDLLIIYMISQKKNQAINKALPHRKHCLTPCAKRSFQDSALRQLATLAFYHQKNSEQQTDAIIKNMPVFLTGQTGTGKTHMIEVLCRTLNLPYIIYNVMNLSANTYKGTNLRNLGENLLKSVDGDKEKAAHAIIFF